METSSLIEVHREPGAKDQLRSYTVLVDGVTAGSLNEGETLRHPVVPGTHKVQLKLDWVGSPELVVEAPQGGTAELACRCGPIPDLRHLFFHRDGYLDLRRAEEAFPPQRSIGRELGLRVGMVIGVLVVMLLV